MTDQRRIHFVSLGCPKNRVDTEVMLGVAERAGFAHTAQPEEAEVIVVNTCGFIEAAKKESIDTILELGQLKQNGHCERLVVTGCLSQRYPEELADGLPEVDHFLGSSDMLKLEHVLRGGAQRNLVGNPAEWVVSSSDPRRLSTRGRSAYVKLAEGCNRSCSFCVIPQLRGKQRSRAESDVVAEVERLADAGVMEINLVSQDTVSYGRDLGQKGALARLVRRIADVHGVRWLRLFYLYPENLGDDLIELLADHPTVVPYVDMPLQHAAEPMLQRMRRGGYAGKKLRALVELLRTRIEDLTFRTAFIVGHPGESDAEFDELCDFVRWAEFDRVGVFRYSDEPTSHSFALGEKISPKTSAARARKLLGIQQRISKKKNQAMVGRELEVLVEGPSEDSELVMMGRHAGQAPEIDGCVYLSGGPVLPGELRRATVTQAAEYDLVAEVAEDAAALESARPVSPAGLVHKSSDGRRVLRTV
jgi:ribosomal protein S12 methylthiotransferase